MLELWFEIEIQAPRKHLPPKKKWNFHLLEPSSDLNVGSNIQQVQQELTCGCKYIITDNPAVWKNGLLFHNEWREKWHITAIEY